MSSPIRVLVVDDSAFARKVLREILAGDPTIATVGIARDGLDALEKIDELKPDIVLLDLLMPGLDGLGVLQSLRDRRAPGPRVLVVSTMEHDSELAIAALEAGAVDIVRKPTALATDRLYEIAAELLATIHALAAATGPRPASATPLPSEAPRARLDVRKSFLAIGASTGGPQAISKILAALPADFPLPVAIALHMPPGYTEALAARLDGLSALDVAEASDGLVVRPGLVLIARAGVHLKVVRSDGRIVAKLDPLPLAKPHRPSVDVLFESAASVFGAGTLGVVLTGMGDDGLEGSRAIRAAGGYVLTESESSCVVYGMPRSVVEAGMSDRAVPLERMMAAILASL
jgi:two-component system chemotaxis response regulator CheB